MASAPGPKLVAPSAVALALAPNAVLDNPEATACTPNAVLAWAVAIAVQPYVIENAMSSCSSVPKSFRAD